MNIYVMKSRKILRLCERNNLYCNRWVLIFDNQIIDCNFGKSLSYRYYIDLDDYALAIKALEAAEEEIIALQELVRSQKIEAILVT